MNNCTWARATLNDAGDIVHLAKTYFEAEVDDVFHTDPQVYEYNLILAIVHQHYNPYSVAVLACRDHNNQLIAYTWITRGERAVWSAEEMITVRMAHVRMDASTRQRVQLVEQMIGFWEVWAQECSVPVICSTTMRHDQSGFLRLHERHGYSVRGSIAYKRIL
jgi:hypothetical protein